MFDSFHPALIYFGFLTKEQKYTSSAWDYEIALPILHWTYKDTIMNKGFISLFVT